MKFTQAMKLRLIVMGCIISVLGGILLIRRGYSPALVGLLVVGIALLVVGLLWKQSKHQPKAS
jgi:glucose uptake protein GlcU